MIISEQLPNTETWNLYKTLKDEILQYDLRNRNYITLAITAAGAILTLGFKSPNPERAIIILCIFAIILPIYRILCGNRKNILRVSTYLRVALEPQLPNVNWETDLYNSSVNDLSKKENSSRIVFNEYRLILFLCIIISNALLMNCIQLISKSPVNFQELIMSQLMTYNNICYFFSFASFLFAFGITIWFSIFGQKMSKRLKRTGEIAKHFEKYWTENVINRH